MFNWLTSDYGLSPIAASRLMGQVVRYDVGNVFDPAYTMVCRIGDGAPGVQAQDCSDRVVGIPVQIRDGQRCHSEPPGHRRFRGRAPWERRRSCLDRSGVSP